MAAWEAGKGTRPHFARAARIVLHIVACFCLEDAAYGSIMREATASARSASVASEGSEPREDARRPGASTLSGGKAPAASEELRGDLDLATPLRPLGAVEDVGRWCQPTATSQRWQNLTYA